MNQPQAPTEPAIEAAAKEIADPIFPVGNNVNRIAAILRRHFTAPASNLEGAIGEKDTELRARLRELLDARPYGRLIDRKDLEQILSAPAAKNQGKIDAFFRGDADATFCNLEHRPGLLCTQCGWFVP